jgi:hypothetical protein
LRHVEDDSHESGVCDVCGRHMLSGERTREYVTRERESRAVCDLCRTQAQRAGWRRADVAEREPSADGEEKRPRRRIRFRPRVSLVRNREPDENGDQDRSSRDTPRSTRRGASETPERRIRRAIDRFNRSEHRRTVAGLTRSLGSPRVAAITPAESPDQVRLTVAWDLSWYQWEVELSDHEIAVHSLGTGREVSELGAADRAWNARASEDGRLQLGPNGDGEAPSPEDSDAA